jgi:transcriptional regulator GlxA family with amidase domain
LKLRLNRARTLLTQTTMPVTEVAFASGFTSASHFSKCYRDMFGRTPRAERRGSDPIYNDDAEGEELDSNFKCKAH